ncbi:TetR/AcrR family transcriptional regulator [Chitinolyticbacter albus]|uniref:TetR/AcrR family transcriptional regulator n=1 Tax=Chitinolyticbacter albus TaxID=2961951 RepID=UPI00210A6B2F|nr:TetR/AcrR family transcriptional regulator [Chitinolyticbacter albus]
MQCPLSKRWSRRKEARPQEILEAALEVFTEKGYTAAKIEDIASRAGVTRGTPYLYFSNKEEIFKAVLRELLLPQLGMAELAQTPLEGSAADALRHIVGLWWERMGATRFSALPKLMIAEARNFPEVAQIYYDEFIAPGQALIRRVLEYGMGRGEFRQVDVDSLLHLIPAPIVMLMIWQHAFAPCAQGAPLDPYRYLDAMLATLLHGIATDSP